MECQIQLHKPVVVDGMPHLHRIESPMGSTRVVDLAIFWKGCLFPSVVIIIIAMAPDTKVLEAIATEYLCGSGCHIRCVMIIEFDMAEELPAPFSLRSGRVSTFRAMTFNGVNDIRLHVEVDESSRDHSGELIRAETRVKLMHGDLIPESVWQRHYRGSQSLVELRRWVVPFTFKWLAEQLSEVEVDRLIKEALDEQTQGDDGAVTYR